MHEIDNTRRGLFVGGTLGALAVAGLATSAQAAPLTPGEAANLKLVQDFIATWGAGEFDPEKVMPVYLASDGRVRIAQDQPFVVGPAAAAAAFRPFLQHGERFKVQFLDVFARGPLVTTHRIDTQVTPGKPDVRMEVVGFFLMKDGKIQEWSDFLVG
jgi:limonene-1,2-epoxide hydrolase